MHGSVRAMLSASTMRHASTTLHYVSAKQQGNVNVSIPRSIQEDIEIAEERETQWNTANADIDSRTALLNEERRSIQDEQRLQRNHRHQYANAGKIAVV